MEDKIEIGEYVRLQYGKIDKVTNNNYYMEQYIECEKKGLYLKKNIVKHSENIIDLIEEGDYVNGKEVTNYYFVGKQKVLVLNNEKVTYEENENFVPQLAIKSVVTKEQFNSIKYEIK